MYVPNTYNICKQSIVLVILPHKQIDAQTANNVQHGDDADKNEKLRRSSETLREQSHRIRLAVTF